MCRRFKIGDLVTAKQTYTGVTVSGEFCGYELEDKERPDLVVGTVIDRAGNQLYRVDLDSIQISETSSEKLMRTLKEFLWNVANGTVRSMPSAEQCQSWLSNLDEQQGGMVCLYKPAPGTIINKAAIEAVRMAEERGSVVLLFNGVAYYVESGVTQDGVLDKFYARKCPAFSDEQIKSLKQARDYYMGGKIKFVGKHLSEIYEKLSRWQNYDEKADK